MSQRFHARCAAGPATSGALLAALALGAHAVGQWVEEEDLPPHPGYFGGAVAVSGDIAIVGAEEVDDVATDAGAAYVFRRTGPGTWVEEDELLAADGAANDFFGDAVAVCGDTALIGAPGRDELAVDSGAVYVFRRNGDGTWTQLQKLVPDGGGAYGGFGCCVAMSGSLAIIGSVGDSTTATFAGAAYGFSQGLDDLWTQEAKLLASDGATEDFFGASVAISGAWAVVGAPFDDDNGANSGSAYAFKRKSNGRWRQRAKILRPGGDPNDFFGFSVGLSGKDAIVGAPWDDDGSAEGSATVFRRAGNVWTKLRRLRASDASLYEMFGSSVAIWGDTAIVGSPDNLLQDGPGAVYSFTRSEEGVWPAYEDAILTAPAPAEVDFFGAAIALCGDFAVVGAPADGGFAGAAYVFRHDRPRAPVIGSLTAAPNPVTHGQILALTATDVTDQNGDETISLVRFYRDSDASGSWEETDQVLATDTSPDGGWTWLGVVPDTWDDGPNTFFARASDEDGGWSDTAQTTCTVWAEPGGDIPPVPPDYDVPPAGNAKMVVLAHGWNATQAQYDNFWLPLAAEIQGVIPDAANWTVWAYDWTALSQWPGAQQALTRAWMLGLALGQQLADQNPEHVHFIAHGAGSGLIGMASARLSELSPQTTIHTTFLDPYAGFLPLHPYETLYGGFADWSDQYYARDATGVWTALRDLPDCHNVDVTLLDPDYVSPLSSHAWPRCFYAHSVNGALLDDCSAPDPPSYGLYGFGLSFEMLGAGWETTIQGYPVGDHVVLPEGPSAVVGDGLEVELEFETRSDEAIDVSDAPHAINGNVAFGGGGFTATAQFGSEPAWIMVEVQAAFPVNFISFDAGFASAPGAHGLLTVYADGTELGMVDEAFAPPGTNTYRMATDGVLEPGPHALAFRLDELAGPQAAVDVTDVATGLGQFVVESVSGEAEGDLAGWSVADAGDVDQDGCADVIIGAPFNAENGDQAGKVYVLSARTGELLFDAVGPPGSRLGWSVAGIGDVNLDGHADVIAGAPRHDAKRGRVYVYSGLDGSELYAEDGAGAGDRLGYAVSGGVDVNDDGHDDFLVSAPWNDEAAVNAGRVTIYSGSDRSVIGTVAGERVGDRFGISVAALGMVDDDTFGDFAVGAPKNDDIGKNAGKVYVYSGQDLSLLYARTAQAAKDRFGWAVAAAGRVDADEYDDFVVGSPFFDAPGADNAGRIDVFSGRLGDPLWAAEGEAAEDRLGLAVAGAGDVDGDGHDDIVAGAYLHDTAAADAGRAYVRSGLDGSLLDAFDGQTADDWLGQAVAGIDDVDDDGLDDVLIAAPWSDYRYPDAGRVYLFLSPDGPGMAWARGYDPVDGRSSVYEFRSVEAPAWATGRAAGTAPSAGSTLHDVLEHWGPCPSGAAGCPGDLNGDGVVDMLDLRLALALMWETPGAIAAEHVPADEAAGVTFVNDGTLAPREHGGVFTVSGDYAQTDGGALVIEIVGPVPVEQHDMLVVAGDARLAGGLRVVAADEFTPVAGDEYAIIAAGSLDGQFEWVEPPEAWRDLALELLYEDATLRLCLDFADGSGCFGTSTGDRAGDGDLTADGLVDVHDLLAVLTAWGERSAEADLNGDGAVDGLDVQALLRRWDD
jgi:hypothetical protein